MISKFGIPRQVITDRDTRWRNDFWAEICRLMGMKRSLTTSYHPQADGQTEVMNQYLEISLRAFIGPNQDDWVQALPSLALSYNSTPHTTTGFSLAYLLRGYHPVTGATLIHQSNPILRPYNSSGENLSKLNSPSKNDLGILVPEAEEMIEEFQAERH